MRCLDSREVHEGRGFADSQVCPNTEACIGDQVGGRRHSSLCGVIVNKSANNRNLPRFHAWLSQFET